MIPAETLAPFFAASLALALAPGPDNLFVLVESARHGRTAGWLVTLGLCTGLLFHTAAVALGLAALIAASAAAFTLVKASGALYLGWLAWGALRSRGGDGTATGEGPQESGGALYRRGILMNITNPKVTIFFLAFLPQFASPERGPLWLQFVALGLVFQFATLLVFGVIAAFAGTFGRLLLGSAAARRALDRFAGLIFLGLALRLAVSRR